MLVKRCFFVFENVKCKLIELLSQTKVHTLNQLAHCILIHCFHFSLVRSRFKCTLTSFCLRDSGSTCFISINTVRKSLGRGAVVFKVLEPEL